MNAYNIKTLPQWRFVDVPAPADSVKWSGIGDPPKIGNRVRVKINDFGEGTVISYFIEHGYLGIEVKPDHRPKWHIEQNPNRDTCLVFGAEIERL